MYGPKWPFLLMYGSHDMRHTGFPWVHGLLKNPLVLGRHSFSCTYTDETPVLSL